MPPQITQSELILNDRHEIYHLGLHPDNLASTIITVGAPDRVGEVSKYFDHLEVTKQHREFITHTGYIGKRRLSVISTGIGTDNIDIVMTEIDALANIDFTTRMPKPDAELKSLKIIRIGTAGSLNKDMPVDSVVAADYALGMEGLLHYYQAPQSLEELQLTQAFTQHLADYSEKIKPYAATADLGLVELFADQYPVGMVATCAGFFGPQARYLRGALAMPELIQRLQSFQFQNKSIVKFEMESSGIYGLSRLLGHQAISLSVIVADRTRGTFTTDLDASVDRLIQEVLAKLTSTSE